MWVGQFSPLKWVKSSALLTVITVDKNVAYSKAFKGLKEEGRGVARPSCFSEIFCNTTSGGTLVIIASCRHGKIDGGILRTRLDPN